MSLILLIQSIASATPSEMLSARRYLRDLPEKEETQIRTAMTKISSTGARLTQVQSGDLAPILVVQGINESTERFLGEWVRPFHDLFQTNHPIYFFKWSKFDTMELNRDILISGIKKILSNHPDQKLTIIGYSAGGLIGLMALDKLMRNPIVDRIYLHTVASPLFGYLVKPWAGTLGIPFVGRSTIDIGIGIYRKLTHRNLKNCQHWVTTNCALDRHSCLIDGRYSPQLRQTNMPCGSDLKLTILPNTSHYEAPEYVIQKLLE